MTLVQWLFAPRRDYRGMSTPSYAARWWLILCCLSTGFWAYSVSQGSIYMLFALSLIVATPLLSLGWYLISIISERIEPRYLLDKAEHAHKTRMERKARESLQQSNPEFG